MATGIEKLSILTVCCFCQIPQQRFLTYIYIVWSWSLKDTCWWFTHFNPEDFSGDVKLVRSSRKDMLLHQTAVMWRVMLCFLFCFHLNPLWKELLLVAFFLLTMLHCICCECELKQALMCSGTLFLSYMAEHYTLWASSPFEEQGGAEPEAHRGRCPRVQSGHQQPSMLICFFFVKRRDMSDCLNIMHEPEQGMEVRSGATVHAVW